jgi:hypothetical protein
MQYCVQNISDGASTSASEVHLNLNIVATTMHFQHKTATTTAISGVALDTEHFVSAKLHTADTNSNS